MTSSRAPEASAEKGAAQPHPDAERLRQFCHAVLSALDAVGHSGAVAPTLPGALVRVIGSGVGEVADELRREADALAAAVANLRGLSSRYLTLPPAAAALVAELEATQAQAGQLASALDSLRAESRSPSRQQLPPPALSRTGLPRSTPQPRPPVAEAPPTVPPAPTPAPAAIPPEQPEAIEPTLSFAPDGTTEILALSQAGEPPPLPPEPRRAVHAFTEGERHRKQREFLLAEERYTEAIGLDPQFGPAYSRRGQIRLARKAIGEAIADFDAALALDDASAEAWWWRGDAHAISNRLDEAIADYTRALALRPDLERARFNLAVAMRRKAEAAARAEPAPSPPPAAPRPQASEAPPQSSGPTPAAKKGSGQLTVSCPHCGEVGEVSWDRLGKVFACKVCDRRFGVNPDGKTVEVTEAPGGKWVEARRVREQLQRRRKRRLSALGVVVAAVLFPAIGFAGWRAVNPPAAASGEKELPPDLEGRAELFARGWLTNDVRLMKRLTSPTHDKVVYGWYTRHQPPRALRGSGSGVPEGTRFEVTRQPGKSGQATVRVRVSNSTAPGQAPVELALLWEERSDGWYFLPPAK